MVKTIRVSDKFHKNIMSQKNPGESFEACIRRLIDAEDLRIERVVESKLEEIRRRGY